MPVNLEYNFLRRVGKVAGVLGLVDSFNMFVRELLANIADGESVRPFCGCKMLLSARAAETAPLPGVWLPAWLR